MKKLLSTIAIGVLLLTQASFAFAEDATPSSKRELVQQKVADKREAIASRSAELKVRLAEFKDKTKAALVERINSTLAKINKVRTQAMAHQLDQMTKLLEKLTNRVDTATTEGKDTASASAAIASASASIASASAAVNAQALKDYTITVSTESAVKTDAKAARDSLHLDLKAVHELVVTARKALSNAVKITASTLEGIGNGHE